MLRTRLITTVCFVFIVSACGGGGGDDGGSSDNVDGEMSAVDLDGEMSDVDSDGDVPVEDDTGSQDQLEVALFPEYQTAAGIEQCSTEDIKQRVDFDMHDYYIYADQSPSLRLDDFDTPEELIRALSVDPDFFSNVQDTAQFTSSLVEGMREDFGFRFNFIQGDAVRFSEINLGSPADRAGILRGDEVITLEGVPISELSNAQINDEILTPENAPVSFEIRTGNDAPRTVVVDYEQYQWRTAGPATKFTPLDGFDLPVVGYLPIKSFLGTTESEIVAAINALVAGDPIEELIVDLRYNPGGFTFLARLLGSIVGGDAVEGELAYTNRWNNEYSSLDEPQVFPELPESLNLSRVFVLATQQSASSSEIFINALKPYIDVVVVGTTTFGKPFTSVNEDYCGKSINAMRIVRENSVGVSVFDGIAPDCPVEDRWQTPTDSSLDPLTGGALSFIQFGVCPVSTDIAEATEQAGQNRVEASAGPRYQPASPIDFAVE